MKCRECREDRTYKLSLKRRKDNRRIYVDEQGRQWNGLQCPTCKYGGFSRNTQGTKLCKCGKFMDKTRYFACLACKPVLESDLGYTLPW